MEIKDKFGHINIMVEPKDNFERELFLYSRPMPLFDQSQSIIKPVISGKSVSYKRFGTAGNSN